MPLQIRPVDLLEQLDVRQRVLIAGAERLPGAHLRDEVLRFALVTPAPDRMSKTSLAPLAAVDREVKAAP